MLDQFSAHFAPEVWKWIIMPGLIFCFRVSDVTLGTIRIIIVTRGMKGLATVFGFMEVFVWLMSITIIMGNLTEFQYYIAYALGFATGNYVGIFLEGKLALGVVVVRVITGEDAGQLLAKLEEEKFGFTNIAARGVYGKVRLIFSIIRRKDVERLMALVNEHAPDAFVSVEDVRSVSSGTLPEASISRPEGPLRGLRK
jgi:uncharacterized protein YebE (UPF0316 family)